MDICCAFSFTKKQKKHTNLWVDVLFQFLFVNLMANNKTKIEINLLILKYGFTKSCYQNKTNKILVKQYCVCDLLLQFHIFSWYTSRRALVVTCLLHMYVTHIHGLYVYEDHLTMYTCTMSPGMHNTLSVWHWVPIVRHQELK